MRINLSKAWSNQEAGVTGLLLKFHQNVTIESDNYLQGKKTMRIEEMEEYIEDLLEDNDSTLELLEALDFDSDFVDGEWSDVLQDDDYLYNQ